MQNLCPEANHWRATGLLKVIKSQQEEPRLTRQIFLGLFDMNEMGLLNQIRFNWFE